MGPPAEPAAAAAAGHPSPPSVGVGPARADPGLTSDSGPLQAASGSDPESTQWVGPDRADSESESRSESLSLQWLGGQAGANLNLKFSGGPATGTHWQAQPGPAA